MNVEIIAVGSELLRHGKSDTNSEWLVRRVQDSGNEVTARAVVIDDVKLLAGSTATCCTRTSSATSSSTASSSRSNSRRSARSDMR